MKIEDFLNHYTLNAPQLMWFLGAGASRSAGMPSATDIIWDLKRRYYCLKEGRDITDNELSNEAVKNRIQSYLEDIGCPPLWADEEYGYFFKLVFGDDPALHQKYLEEKLKPTKISVNSGHRVLAALMGMKLTRVIFTTNFDSVIESAHSFITGSDLRAYDLNGSYAALNALNNENFPLYAKMHGDFRYYEMKNLPENLINNDKEIEKCFINACSRYGLIVSGYSGRDKNVMDAFSKALENTNAFPKGLFWITSIQGHVFPAVTEFIEKAKANGINANIVEADTFDSLLGSIWKVIPNKKHEYDKKIRRSIFEIPKIPKYTLPGSYPLIRTNAFPILQMPSTCLSIETKSPLSTQELVLKIKATKSSSIMSRDRTILAWGDEAEIYKVISESEIKKSETLNLESYLTGYRQNTSLNSFCARAIARAIVKDKPLILRKRKEKYYAVISSKHEKFSDIDSVLKSALKTYHYSFNKKVEPKALAGKVPGLIDTYWMECAEISLEYYDGKFWLIIVPDIWIEPSTLRKNAKEFLSVKKKSRYNETQNELIDAWKKILFGDDTQVRLSTFNNTVAYNANFEVGTTTAYSQKAKQ